MRARSKPAASLPISNLPQPPTLDDPAREPQIGRGICAACDLDRIRRRAIMGATADWRDHAGASAENRRRNPEFARAQIQIQSANQLSDPRPDRRPNQGGYRAREAQWNACARSQSRRDARPVSTLLRAGGG